MDSQIRKLQLKFLKLNLHETFSIFSEKHMVLILHFQLFPNVTRKVGGFVGSCWVLDKFQRKDTNLRREIPAAEQRIPGNAILGVR